MSDHGDGSGLVYVQCGDQTWFDVAPNRREHDGGVNVVNTEHQLRMLRLRACNSAAESEEADDKEEKVGPRCR
jgi:hypothetical protein